MNLFTQYGIKEVADITIYSIMEIGDEEFYLPVLYLDTLKISDIEEKSSNANAQGGYGNTRIKSWDFNKTYDLKIKDALFSPASMSLVWGGWLDHRFDRFANLIAKISIMLKYKNMNYSIYAYPSPKLTEEEKDILFFGVGESCWMPFYKKEQARIEENRVKLLKAYYNRNDDEIDFITIITRINSVIQHYNFSNYTTNIYNTQYIDRMEKCKVEQDEFKIDIQEQKNNLFKFFQNDKDYTYNIYYDEKTMKPLIYNQSIKSDDKKIILHRGTSFLKWTRYVNNGNASLGKHIVLTADSFNRYYKIVGETNIREQKTGKDQRFQISINKAKINLGSTLTLEATGDPTVFEFNVTAVSPKNDVIIEMKQFDTENDCYYGGTRILPQDQDYTETGIKPANENSNVVTINEYY